MMYIARQCMLIAHLVLLLCVSLCVNGQPLPELKKFDKLITRELVAAGFKQTIQFSFKVSESEKTRVYESAYQFKQRSPEEHYTCSISVAPAGVLLDPHEYERRRADAGQRAANRRGEYLSEEFPSIGKRALRQVFGAGPGGAAYGLTFTTSDGKFDIRIMVSNLLPEGVKDPDFDILKTAQNISRLYEHKSG